MPIWGPDTCSCEIEYQGSFTSYQAVNVTKCARHAALTNSAAFAAAHADNGRKNRAVNWVQANHPDLIVAWAVDAASGAISLTLRSADGPVEQAVVDAVALGASNAAGSAVSAVAE